MNTPNGEIIHVEANGLADYANGKRLFENFQTPVNRTGGARYAELMAVGIIEAGCTNGEPSLTFLSFHEGETPDQDQWYIHEISAPGLRKLCQSLETATKHFNTNSTGVKQ